MVKGRPHRVVLTAHAIDRAGEYGRTAADVADLVIDHHHERQRNTGRAAWRVSTAATTVLYDWPDGDDASTARVVTLWARV